MLEIKNTVTKIKNAYNRLTSRLDTVEERITDLEGRSTETTQTEIQRDKRMRGYKLLVSTSACKALKQEKSWTN